MLNSDVSQAESFCNIWQLAICFINWLRSGLHITQCFVFKVTYEVGFVRSFSHINNGN